MMKVSQTRGLILDIMMLDGISAALLGEKKEDITSQQCSNF